MTERAWVHTLLAKKGYNADQPRDPAGTPTGGRWTSGGATLGSDPIGYAPGPDVLSAARAVAQNDINYNAERFGITPGEMEEVIGETLRYIVDSTPVSIRRGLNGATAVLESGRFMSQFETGMSAGVYDPQIRMEAERMGLGVPLDVDYSKRPIYGYIETPGHTASDYGSVEFVLNDDVKPRTTMTVTDSLYKFRNKQLVGSRLDTIDKGSWDTSSAAIYRERWDEGVDYIEAQVHGGVRLKDVRKIVIRGLESGEDEGHDALAELATKKGIKVYWGYEQEQEQESDEGDVFDLHVSEL